MTSQTSPMLELSVEEKTVREPNGSLIPLFRGLTLNITQPGETIAIMGRSGSGKTTLLRILSGLDLRYTGTYSLRGQRIVHHDLFMSAMRLRNIGIITQNCHLLTDRNVQANVMLGAPHSTRQEVTSLLSRVGLSGFEKKPITQLSGGEAQRVCIARALIKKPAILIADEPTGALDADTETSILSLLSEIANDRTSIVCATHSDRVAQVCMRVLHISDRTLVSARR